MLRPFQPGLCKESLLLDLRTLEQEVGEGIEARIKSCPPEGLERYL